MNFSFASLRKTLLTMGVISSVLIIASPVLAIETPAGNLSVLVTLPYGVDECLANSSKTTKAVETDADIENRAVGKYSTNFSNPKGVTIEILCAPVGSVQSSESAVAIIISYTPSQKVAAVKVYKKAVNVFFLGK